MTYAKALISLEIKCYSKHSNIKGTKKNAYIHTELSFNLIFVTCWKNNSSLLKKMITLITADRLSDDAFSSDDGEVPDEFLLDANNMEMNRVLDNLREEIKFDENIAMKSAMLLKLLEVRAL